MLAKKLLGTIHTERQTFRGEMMETPDRDPMLYGPQRQHCAHTALADVFLYDKETAVGDQSVVQFWGHGS